MRTVVLAVLTIAVAGCAQSTSGITTITFWTIGHEGEVVQPLLREFERSHPTIRVALQQWPMTAAHEKLLTAFAGDALPDLSQLGNTWIPELATLGALQPLQPYVDATPSVAQADYFPGIWDSNVIDGRLFGVPWYVDTRLLFYRKDMLLRAGFSAAPRDWTEWQHQLAAIKAQAGANRYAILLPLNEAEPLLNLAIQEPDPLLKDNGTRGNFESAGFRRAFDFYIGMFREHWAPPMSDTQIANVWDEFAAGFFAFYISGPWNVSEFSQRMPPRLARAWGTAPLPGPDGPGAAIGGGSSLVMFQTSQHKDAVWQLIAFLSQPVNQVRFHALSGDLPPRRSAWRDPSLADDPYAKAFADQLERVKSAPKVPEWERIAQEVRLTTESVVRGGEPIDSALRGLDKRVDAILAKRRWMLARGRSREQRIARRLVSPQPGAARDRRFFLVPVLAAFALSLTDFDLYALADLHNLRFVGLGNYLDILRTPLFWKSLVNTLYFVGVGVPLSIAASLAAALLLNSRLARFKGFFRTALFAPVVTTVVAVAVIWRYLLHTRYGLINYALGLIGIAPVDWLGDPHWSMPSIIVFAVWKNFGYNMIILLAALQAIPGQLYEAARIDGASGWQQLRHITVPMLRPALLLVSIITVSGYFQLFAEPYVMTQGDPLQSTVSVLYFMYNEGFKWWSLGRASAIAFLLFVLILVVTSVLLRYGRRGEST